MMMRIFVGILMLSLIFCGLGLLYGVALAIIQHPIISMVVILFVGVLVWFGRKGKTQIIKTENSNQNKFIGYCSEELKTGDRVLLSDGREAEFLYYWTNMITASVVVEDSLTLEMHSIEIDLRDIYIVKLISREE